MLNFEKLLKRLLVHEAFDKVYPLKDKNKHRPIKDIQSDLDNLDQEHEAEIRRKEYATNRMPWWDREDTIDRIHNRTDRTRSNLEWEKGEREKYEKKNEKYKDLTEKIIQTALQRTGSPREDILRLDSITKFAHDFVAVYQYKTEYENFLKKRTEYRQRSSSPERQSSEEIIAPEPPNIHPSTLQFRTIKQPFEGKAGDMIILITPFIDVAEHGELEHRYGILDVSFSTKTGNFWDMSKAGDAAQVVATVMEFAFAVFCVYEAAIKLLFPDFYEWKTTSFEPKVVKFSPTENDEDSMNARSKTAREGINKRGRLYTLGWERSMKKRVPDLELISTGGSENPIIYICYKK